MIAPPPPPPPVQVAREDAPPEVLTAFHDFDIDGNGLIDPLELGQVLKKLDANTFTDEAIQALFSGADADRDGKIDLNEFMSWMFDPRARAVREALDKDRMLKIGMILLTIDLPWMKQDVSQTSFHRYVLSLRKPQSGNFFELSEGADTLGAAHALLSVGKAFVPEYAILERRMGGINTPARDEEAAPLLYAALAAGCRHLKACNVAWGERCTEAIEHGLIATDCGICTLSLSGVNIKDDEMTARIVDAIGQKSTLTSIDLSNNVVGLEGLQALSEALERCPSLRNVYLYNIGPWIQSNGVDCNGLGCCRRPDTDDMVLLHSIRKMIKKRNGEFQNEAFHEGDCYMSDDSDADDSRIIQPGSKATVIDSCGVKLQTRPSGKNSAPYESGYLAAGQDVLVLRLSHHRGDDFTQTWASVQALSVELPLKGWVKIDALESRS